MRDAQVMTTDESGPAARAPGAQEMTVGAVAALLGVSVRTLHHWDELGLACPSARSWSGYRLYNADDIARLHQVLIYRETGMPLARIKDLLVEADLTSTIAHLARQRELLTERISRLERMVRAIDTMMEKETMGAPLTAQEWTEIWGTDWDPAYAQEAEQRWGDTEDWAEAARRQARMSKVDWMRAYEETESLETALADAFTKGVEPGSPRANTLAERHRADLNRWFEVSVSKQVLIARGYVADERFARHYNRRAPGLAAWLKEVVDASARAQGVDPSTARWS